MPIVSYKGRRFTHKQVEILKLVGLGLSNAEIAVRLILSKRTVESHLSNIRRIFARAEHCSICDRRLVLFAIEMLDAYNHYHRQVNAEHSHSATSQSFRLGKPLRSLPILSSA